jgi:hypothetical protein
MTEVKLKINVYEIIGNILLEEIPRLVAAAPECEASQARLLAMMWSLNADTMDTEDPAPDLVPPVLVLTNEPPPQ